MEWAEETGQIKAALGPFMDKRMRERKAYVARTQFTTPKNNKIVRAQSIRGRMALDGLYVPVRARWYEQFRSELLMFPSGKHDDQVDALGLVGLLLDVMVDGRKPPRNQKIERDAYGESREERYADDTATL